LRSYGGLKLHTLKIAEKFLLFLENDPYGKFFKTPFPIFFIAIPIVVFCSNFVKFGQQEIG